MSQHDSVAIRKPRTDGQPLWDIVFGLWAGSAVLVAHDLKFFSLLAAQPRTLAEVCEALHIAARPAEALLSVCVVWGLMHVQDGRYSLTSTAEDYLLEGSPTYFGGFWDFVIANHAMFSCASVKQAVLTNASQVYRGEEMFKAHEEQANRRVARRQSFANRFCHFGPYRHE